MKFKLIKTYPGSPKLGTVVTDTNPNNGAMDSYFSLDWGISGKCAFKIGKDHNCESNPEFWEPVTQCCEKDTDFDGNCPIHRAEKIVIRTYIPKKEYEIKDYEIVSLVTNTYFGITDSAIDIKAFNEGFGAQKCSIHSIKRVSDGVIFTVGDLVNNLNNPNSWNIEKISIEKRGVRIDSRIGGVCPSFQNLQHAKKPLFTTSDGVKIFEGDKYWYVPKSELTATSKMAHKGSGTKGINVVYFATELAAKEYILKNKPCLSLKDVENLLYCGSIVDIKQSFKNLVEQRIK
jgi:hypothetical protein